MNATGSTELLPAAAPRLSCSHCGLPVYTTAREAAGRVFCCHGCYLASRIVGNQDEQGDRAWIILRLAIGALLSMNVMMIALLLYTGSIERSTVPIFRWTMLALAAPAMILLAYPFLIGAATEIRRRRLSLDTLIAVGSFTAFGVSAFNTVRGAGHVYFDTATMLPLLVTFGRLIEASAKTRARDLIRGLETLLPATARRVESDGDHDVDIGALKAGDHLRIRPGERIPADGRILEGQTSIREADFTGEPGARVCNPGDSVIGGTINGGQSIVIEAERVGGDILLRRIIGMVGQAQGTAAPWERLSARMAAVFTPAILAIALIAGTAWLVIDGPAKGAFVALAMLVVSCPCAMGIATPLATAMAIGRAARSGVVVRGGDILERIGEADVVFFDKTGTVTTSEPTALGIERLDASVTEEEILGRLAALESASEHPLAKSVVAETERRGIERGHLSQPRVFPGQGIEGRVTWRGVEHDVIAGSERFLGSHHDSDAHDGTVICVSWDGSMRGRLRFRDAVREDAQPAVRALHSAGLRTQLISGDRPQAAQDVADRIGIGQTYASCSPEDKIRLIRSAAESGLTAIMVGDGINDAPALAAADIGIALGAGTDLARQSGHVVLVSNRLIHIPWLIGLSRRTREIIRQNLFWAFGYNAVALAAAATGLLHPLLAAVAMAVSSITLLSNSLRLQRFPDA